jgi:putative transcriptional regulator
MESPYLTGQLLIAMPGMRDPRFSHSVIYMCAHNEQGAMGLVLNRLIESITLPDLLSQLSIEQQIPDDAIRIRFGGPVESGRGFVLHSTDYAAGDTLRVDEEVGLTASLDILRAIAGGDGPRQRILALGYAGWGPGQLDAEIQSNGWLSAPADERLLFDERLDDKWERAIRKLGIDAHQLSTDSGHA